MSRISNEEKAREREFERKMSMRRRKAKGQHKTEEQAQLARREHGLSSYDAFFETYLADEWNGYTPSAWYHRKFVDAFLHGEKEWYVLEWYVSAGKSTAFKALILYALALGHKPRLLFVSATAIQAVDLINPIREQIKHNQLLQADFALYVKSHVDSANHFELTNGATFWAKAKDESFLGLVNSENARPTDIAIDDYDTEDSVKNPNRLDKDWKLLTEKIYGRLGTMETKSGKQIPGRMWIIGNPLAKDSTIKRAASRVKRYYKDRGFHLRVPALNAKGQSNWPEMYSTDFLLQKKADMEAGDPASWQTIMMLNPVSSHALWRHGDIEWREMADPADYIYVCIYFDPSFKATDRADYKAISAWGLVKGREEYEHECFDRFVGKCELREAIVAMADIYDRLPPATKTRTEVMIENTGSQVGLYEQALHILRNEGRNMPLIQDRRQKNSRAHGTKEDRISMLKTFYEQKRIFWNASKRNNNFYQIALKQYTSFDPKNRHNQDDCIDADEGAVFWTRSNEPTFFGDSGDVMMVDMGAGDNFEQADMDFIDTDFD